MDPNLHLRHWEGGKNLNLSILPTPKWMTFYPSGPHFVWLLIIPYHQAPPEIACLMMKAYEGHWCAWRRREGLVDQSCRGWCSRWYFGIQVVVARCDYWGNRWECPCGGFRCWSTHVEGSNMDTWKMVPLRYGNFEYLCQIFWGVAIWRCPWSLQYKWWCKLTASDVDGQPLIGNWRVIHGNCWWSNV